MEGFQKGLLRFPMDFGMIFNGCWVERSLDILPKSIRNPSKASWASTENLLQVHPEAIENQLQDVSPESSDLQILKEIAFLKNCILLSNLTEYDKQRVIDRAILYPCEDGGFRVLDEQSKIMTSNIMAVDLQNNLFLTESGKVYVHNQLLVADLESQELKVLSEVSGWFSQVFL